MLTLFRYSVTQLRTLGIFFYDGEYVTDTLELGWNRNSPFISSIPEGIYKIVWSEDGHKVGPCYGVEGVEGREGILIHQANDVAELEGCIAVGERYGDTLWHSDKNLTLLHAVCGSERELKVTSVFGG